MRYAWGHVWLAYSGVTVAPFGGMFSDGLRLRAATGYTKAVNLASNLGSLAVFLMFGSVHFGAAAVMIVGQLLGARLGSGLVIAKGARLIRPVFLSVVLALAVKLAFDAWGG